MTLLILILAAFLTSTLSAIMGMGGGILLIAILYFFVEPIVAIPLHGIIQLSSNFTRVLLFRKNIKFEHFIPFSFGVPFGILCGWYLFGFFEAHIMKLLLGIFLIFAANRKKGKGVLLSKNGFSFLGVISGTASMLFGATGPLIAPFFLHKSFNREQVIASKAAFQTLGHFLKTLAFFILPLAFPIKSMVVYDFFKEQYLLVILMVLAVIYGTRFGKQIGKKVTELNFKKFFRILLNIIGAKLILIDGLLTIIQP